MLFYIKKVVSRKRIVKGNWEEMINYIGEKLREDEVLDVKWINFFFFFCLLSWHVKILSSGIEPVPQEWH